MDFGMLGSIAWWVQALVWVFVLICVFLIIIVLLQKGRGGGLSAAFGGAGGQSAFGSKTGDVFTWVTIVITAVFLLLAMVMTRVYRPENVESQFNSSLTAPAGKTNSAGKAAPVTSQDKGTANKAGAKADGTAGAAAGTAKTGGKPNGAARTGAKVNGAVRTGAKVNGAVDEAGAKAKGDAATSAGVNDATATQNANGSSTKKKDMQNAAQKAAADAVKKAGQPDAKQ